MLRDLIITIAALAALLLFICPQLHAENDQGHKQDAYASTTLTITQSSAEQLALQRRAARMHDNVFYAEGFCDAIAQVELTHASRAEDVTLGFGPSAVTFHCGKRP